MNITIGLAVVLLVTCGSSLAYECGVSASIENLVRILVDESIDNLRGSGDLCYLGMRSHLIPDSAITASSYWATAYESFRARLDNKIVTGSTGSWSSATNAVGQYLQVDLGRPQSVAGIIMQSRPTRGSQWVKTYKVSCGTDLHHLSFFKENGEDKVFTGNTGMDTKVYARFPQVSECRYIRIYPQTWNNHMSMRVEFVAGACFNNPHLPY